MQGQVQLIIDKIASYSQYHPLKLERNKQQRDHLTAAIDKIHNYRVSDGATYNQYVILYNQLMNWWYNTEQIHLNQEKELREQVEAQERDRLRRVQEEAEERERLRKEEEKKEKERAEKEAAAAARKEKERKEKEAAEAEEERKKKERKEKDRRDGVNGKHERDHEAEKHQHQHQHQQQRNQHQQQPDQHQQQHQRQHQHQHQQPISAQEGIRLLNAQKHGIVSSASSRQYWDTFKHFGKFNSAPPPLNTRTLRSPTRKRTVHEMFQEDPLTISMNKRPKTTADSTLGQDCVKIYVEEMLNLCVI